MTDLKVLLRMFSEKAIRPAKSRACKVSPILSGLLISGANYAQNQFDPVGSHTKS